MSVELRYLSVYLTHSCIEHANAVGGGSLEVSWAFEGCGRSWKSLKARKNLKFLKIYFLFSKLKKKEISSTIPRSSKFKKLLLGSKFNQMLHFNYQITLTWPYLKPNPRPSQWIFVSSHCINSSSFVRLFSSMKCSDIIIRISFVRSFSILPLHQWHFKFKFFLIQLLYLLFSAQQQ